MKRVGGEARSGTPGRYNPVFYTFRLKEKALRAEVSLLILEEIEALSAEVLLKP